MSKIKVGDIVTANRNYNDYYNEAGIQYEVKHVGDFLGEVGIFVFDPRTVDVISVDENGSNGIFLEHEVDVVASDVVKEAQ